MSKLERLQKIESGVLKDHVRLNEADECYYFLEYTSGRNYRYGKANSLISNIKKSPSSRNRPGWKYKQRDMAVCSEAFSKALNPDWLREATLVPVPPSKAKGHLDYDDRMLKIVQGIDIGFPLDIRELVLQTTSLHAAHESPDHRTTDTELFQVYQIDEKIASPTPTLLGIFDDVLTTGAHFRAMAACLQERFENVPIVGLFIARRVFA